MGGPVRILHAVVNMNRGGAETLIMNLYRHIDRSRVQFDFLTSKAGEFDQEIIQLGGKIHRIPYVTEAGHLGYLRALGQFFASHRDYQIVHAHMDKMSGWVLRAARGAGIPIRMAHSHGTQSEGGILQRGYKWISGQYITSNATHTLACSTSAANWLYSTKASKATIIKNGIDCSQFAYSPDDRREIRKQLKIPQRSLVIGHVGRFDKVKNQLFLIHTFHHLVEKKVDATLVLAGDGPLRAQVQDAVDELKLTNKVKFLGIRKDIPKLLQAFDVFMFPSLHEGLPVTLVEAQGAGLPCVVSNAITDEVDLGLDLVKFLPLGDPASWAEEIVHQAMEQSNRICNLDVLAEKGFDIRHTAKWIEHYYLAQYRGEWIEDANRIYAHV